MPIRREGVEATVDPIELGWQVTGNPQPLLMLFKNETAVFSKLATHGKLF